MRGVFRNRLDLARPNAGSCLSPGSVCLSAKVSMLTLLTCIKHAYAHGAAVHLIYPAACCEYRHDYWHAYFALP